MLGATCGFAGLFAVACSDDEGLVKDGAIPTDTTWQLDTASYTGGTLLIFNGFVKPYGFALGPQGNLYVTDLQEGRVIRFTQNFLFTGWLGSVQGVANSQSGWHVTGLPDRGTASGQLYMPHSVTFDYSGSLFVGDYMTGAPLGRVHRYAPDGGYLGLLFDNPTDATLQFEGIANACFDAHFNLWVSDFDGHRVFKFAPDRSLIGWLGEKSGGGLTDGFATTGRAQQSSALGGLFHPHMVQVDDSGFVYVVEGGNNRIQKFDAGGHFVGWIGGRGDGTLTDGWESDGTSRASADPGGFSSPVSIRLIPGSAFLVADNGNNRIQKFGMDGRFMAWLGGKEGGGVTAGWEISGRSAIGTVPGAFDAPFDAQLRNGRLYVADGHNGRIQIFEIPD
jgi:DNA-binding beta-propeller fold protein YncE